MSHIPLIPVTTMAGRIGVVLLGCVLLVVFLAGAARLSPSFFRGFLVATGTFLSVDMILFHWIFRIHRLTSGPEADVMEPLFVVLGVVFIVVGLRGERALEKTGGK
ncbi:MAG TPA: DUF2243 domain-containing protein [Gemmatimonadaceae bacterium]|nr:DUF2243 domain-containing protein [Gemmatimonadaceae bacterium]